MSGTSREDFRVRAYMVKSTAAFMQERLGEAQSMRILEGLSPETQRAVSSSKLADWCAVSAYAELLRAVAAESKGDDAHAQETLVACGEFVAREATNTFLRMFMKLLTPSLFAKKLPDVWKRDCSGGRFEVDVTSERLVFRLFDIQGFDHVPCTAAGFVKFALTGMGKTIGKTSIHNWSLSQPCEEGAWVELVWKS